LPFSKLHIPIAILSTIKDSLQRMRLENPSSRIYGGKKMKRQDITTYERNPNRSTIFPSHAEVSNQLYLEHSHSGMPVAGYIRGNIPPNCRTPLLSRSLSPTAAISIFRDATFGQLAHVPRKGLHLKYTVFRRLDRLGPPASCPGHGRRLPKAQQICSEICCLGEIGNP
jgi:hypothetical protein